MRSDAETVDAYLAELPDDRRAALQAVREVIVRNLPEHVYETMAWGMITYEIPLELSGKTYNGKPLMYAALASQKHHMAIYLCGLYCIDGMAEKFADAFAAPGHKVSAGKGCIRFKALDELNLNTVQKVIRAVPTRQFIAASRRG